MIAQVLSWSPRPGPVSGVVTNLLVAVSYLFAGMAVHFLVVPPGYASALWPAAGIAFMALLMLGNRVWPGVLLGALAANLCHSGLSLGFGPQLITLVPMALGMAIASVLQEVVAVYLVRRFVGYPTALLRPSETLLLLGLAGPLACLIAPTAGVGLLLFHHLIPLKAVPYNWFSWYVGDTLGVLIVVPIALAWVGKPVHHWRPRRLQITLPLLVALGVSMGAFFLAQHQERIRVQIEFTRQAREAGAGIQASIDRRLTVIKLLRTHFNATQSVDPKNFKLLAQDVLQSHPGFMALEWVPRVTGAARAAFEQQMRQEGHPGFEITERRSDGTVHRAGERADYFPVALVEPFTDNQKALGYDLASDGPRWEAMRMAMIAGDPMASQTIDLVQGPRGILLLVPVFEPGVVPTMPVARQKALRGFAIGVFRISDIFETPVGQSKLNWIHFSVRDQADPRPDFILHQHPPETGGESTSEATTSGISLNLPLAIPGRSWTLSFLPTLGFLDETRSSIPWMVQAAALLFTGLLGIFLVLVSGRAQSVSLEVIERTQELKATHQAMSESEARYRELFNAMTDACATVDLDGHITAFNVAFRELVGRPEAEIPQLTYEDITPAKWHALEAEIIREQVFTRGFSEIYQKEYRKGNGTFVPVELKTFLIRDTEGNPTAMSAIIRDISERQKAEEELQRHREHLEDLVATRTSELQNALQAAEAANEAKSAFLASMSHELRTPLNAVLGFAQLMAREPDRSLKDLVKLEKILRAGEHLLELINDVLSLSRIEAHKLGLNTTSFDLHACMEGIEEMIRIRAEAKQLTFEVQVSEEIPAAVEGDEGKLRQVLLNLLGNAVKFTKKGRLELAVMPHGEDRIHFAVSDTGPGISPEEMSKLFGTFVQTESGRRSAEGSGLGLNLSQALVRLMGGEISVQSKVEQGSTFSFTLPLKAVGFVPNRATGRRRLVLSGDRPAPKQLVADDKADNRELLTEYLESMGFPVQSATDGEKAVEIWRSWQPQVIWMDMRMPVLDGYEATRRIRSLEAELGRPRTAILAITASAFDLDQAAILAVGCDAILHKPFREQELFESLALYAGVRFLEEEVEPLRQDRLPEPVELESLEPVWRGAFLQCLLAGDIERARQLTEGLPPAPAALKAYLQQALQEFRLDELERLLAPR